MRIKWEAVGTIVEWVGIVFAVGFGILNYKQNNDQGQLIIHQPTEFCIARGYQVFPSDHIILPINIENTGLGAKTIELLTLNYHDPNSANSHRFAMAGLIGNVDAATLNNDFQMVGGITVPEKSLGHYAVVFQIEKWWDVTSDDFTFRFPTVNESIKLDMQLGYFSPGETGAQIWNQGAVFFSMPIYLTDNRLRLSDTVLNETLHNPNVIANSALYDRMRNEQTSTYNSDCFALRDLPTFPLSSEK